MYWREYQGDDGSDSQWTSKKFVGLQNDGQKYSNVEASECLPMSTYQVRLVGVDENGEESESSRTLVIDTCTPDCTPDTGCSCVIS